MWFTLPMYPLGPPGRTPADSPPHAHFNGPLQTVSSDAHRPLAYLCTRAFSGQEIQLTCAQKFNLLEVAVSEDKSWGKNAELPCPPSNPSEVCFTSITESPQQLTEVTGSLIYPLLVSLLSLTLPQCSLESTSIQVTYINSLSQGLLCREPKLRQLLTNAGYCISQSCLENFAPIPL